MNGAESLVRTLVAGGVDVCFTNPGTSEMHFVAALDRVEGMRCVLGLFEGVVTGAADGYFRMKGTPASTLLHLGPGLANGLANLHNAKKANSGIVNIVGQHATYHIAYNAPLTSDIEGLARPMSSWVRTSPDATSVSRDGAAAIAAARGAPPQIATLILPADTAWNEADGVAEVPVESQRRSYSPQAVDNVAKVLRGGGETLLLMTGSAMTEKGLALAAQIAGKTGCRVMGPLASPRMARGRGRFSIERGALRDRTGASGAERFSAHRAGRSQRSRGIFRLSEQAEHAEA
jgi:acetolactate synthase I/II/III large subunit